MFKEKIQIQIHSPEHSKQVQQALFKMGHAWIFDGTAVSFTDRPVLFAYPDGRLTHGNYIQDSVPEYEMHLIPTFVRTKEKMEINGKTYYKEDVEKALAPLSTVEE